MFGRKIAILGGAGAEFAGVAKSIGADLYLTGDLKYHEAQDAAMNGLVIADGGHLYGTCDYSVLGKTFA